MRVISFESVVYSYGENDALDGINFEVEAGEFVAVIGHNGSGKSTLAKHINALFTPQSGRVLVMGMDTLVEENVLSIRQHAGMVFQNPDNQMVTTIVEEDVAFGPENLGVPPDEIRKRVDEALSAVNMGEFSLSAPHRMSGGQKQRIAIAGILAMKPDIIVFDEPTAMLDPTGREEVLRTARALNKDGITIVWITHFMEEAAIADRIVVINDGAVAMTGTPREIFDRPDELDALDMDLPFASRVCAELRARGLEARKAIDEKELVDELCRLLSNT